MPGKAMQWILFIVGGLVGLLILLVIVGMLLPRNHVAASSIELAKPPAEVWGVVRDIGQVPTFWTDIKSSERQPDREGHEVWVQTMKNGFTLPLEIDEDRPPSRLVSRIAMEGKAPFGGSWIYEIAESGTGSRVTVTEDGWVDNPFFRVVSRIMGHHATLDSYLRALGKRFGENVQPVHQP
jgi:uncharacterized protein YndB with AHSA1/START domain